ncbi:MAG: LacI family DNA-binding transcriptional regulator [Propionivibrio sp.]
MKRVTIKDLAEAAGVSVATVNRVIGRSGPVSESTLQRVLEAARGVGFYGLAGIEHGASGTKRKLRLGFVIQSPHRLFAATLAKSIEGCVASGEVSDVQPLVELIDDLSPDSVATRMLALGVECDALGVLAAEHPIVTEAIERLAAANVPVVALITALSARTNVGYVGLDSWKVGRTAAWALHHMGTPSKKIAMFVGTHRYRCHDLYESGFRSYFREHANSFTLLEPVSTFESDAIAREITEDLLREHRDLGGLYVSGGGIGGVIAALRASGGREVVTVGHDLMETTRAGLLDGSLTLVISHPFATVARETLAALVRARHAGPEDGTQSVIVPFEIYNSENL